MSLALSGAALAATLLVCTTLLQPLAATAGERIVDARSGAEVGQDALVAALRKSRYILLGERHDNPRHHERRGEIVRSLGRSIVVAEHLPRGGVVDFGTLTLDGRDPDALQNALSAAGFDGKGWRWPLPYPLFSEIAASGSRLLGGNLPRDAVRDIARNGVTAAPDDIAREIAAHPLAEMADARLDADLIRGHCNELPATRLPGLRLAQQARDAAMAAVLRNAEGTAEGSSPLLLVAGNGHVRRDYGVPRFLIESPTLSTSSTSPVTLSIGFVEDESELEAAQRDGLYDYVWLTAAPARPDPCAELRGTLPSRQ